MPTVECRVPYHPNWTIRFLVLRDSNQTNRVYCEFLKIELIHRPAAALEGIPRVGINGEASWINQISFDDNSTIFRIVQCSHLDCVLLWVSPIQSTRNPIDGNTFGRLNIYGRNFSPFIIYTEGEIRHKTWQLSLFGYVCTSHYNIYLSKQYTFRDEWLFIRSIVFDAVNMLRRNVAPVDTAEQAVFVNTDSHLVWSDERQN